MSVHILPADIAPSGSGRVALLRAYAAIGLSRVMALVPGSSAGDAALADLARDARAAGVELA